ncbi:SGNH/GDSL hydrolase family protein [Acetobacter persici]|uniref:SGNH/GDSL hydrolase family protein n=1 Tax=Acetobacter persici TaxID=1076596 RepID=UPI001F1F4F41|nr:SGNH/GDSL hydrolase family protein [Acetobacter persici]MCG0998824.1 SGNH/GDSL hydrolase family protein [Acetobacter persici]
MENDINKFILERIQTNKTSGDKIVYFPFNEEVFIDKNSKLLQENDTIWIGSNVTIHGPKRKAVHPPYLGTPFMFPPTVTGRHLKNFHQACSEGEATVVCMGDSILSVGADLVSPFESPWNTLSTIVSAQNTDTRLKFYNRAIAGTSWADMNSEQYKVPMWWDISEDKSWRDSIVELAPNLLFLYSGGNDQYNFNQKAFQELLKFFKENLIHCDIILCITFLPSTAAFVNDYVDNHVQEGIIFVSEYVRNYAITHSYGYLDFGRWHAMCRDGVDPCAIALTKIKPDRKTILQEWGEEINPSKYFIFPEVYNDNGTCAKACTDWLLCFTIKENPQSIIFPLSSVCADFRKDSSNYGALFFDGDKIVFQYADGVSNPIYSKVSDIYVPQFPLTISIGIKKNNLRISILTKKKNGWIPSIDSDYSNELGFETLFEGNIVRFGGSYTPYIHFPYHSSAIIIHNLCIADTTHIDNNQRRFMPIVTDAELYEASYAAGGSGAYHMNAYGVMKILAPVIESQQWYKP